MPQSALEELSKAITDSQFSLWAPNPGPQAIAYRSPADELFYGGASGGGKSALIIGLARNEHQRTLIVRRESTQLRGMVDDLARILGTRDGFNSQTGQWRIPRSLSTRPDQLIEFQGVPNPGDEERHQGISHDLLAFDEVTQLREYTIDYLSTWNRSVTPGQRTRMVLTSNPPTPSTSYRKDQGQGLWLITRYGPWLDPSYRDPLHLGAAQPGELRWFVTLDGREEEWPDGMPFLHRPPSFTETGREEIITPRSRTFIPALPTDNPYLGENYLSALQKLPEPLRSAFLYGDFAVSLMDQPMQLLPAEWVRAAVQRHRDLAHSSPPPTHNQTQTALGVDVARGGADSTIVFARYGAWFELHVIPALAAKDGPDVAAEVLKRRRSDSTIVVDANGVGASVYDHLRTLGIEPVIGYVGSKTSTKRDSSRKFGFANTRSQVYWGLREALDPSGPMRIAIPDDPELIGELLTLTWEEQSGKIKVMTKKDHALLLGRSPDKADALTLALSVGEDDWLAESPVQGVTLPPRVAQGPSWDSRLLSSINAPRRKTRWNAPTSALRYPRR